MRRIELGGQWQFRVAARRANGAHADVSHWMSAVVPGTVHTDLMAAGIIPDPFVRRNELDAQWVEHESWIYRRVFELEEDFLREDRIQLVAEGLDTYAHITINRRAVGETDNMFIAHRFDVKRFLKIGQNVIEIRFDSPVARSKALEQKHGALTAAPEPHRVYVRKAQYSFGWDWGPKLTTSGIWRPIRLEAFSACRVADVRVRTVRIADDAAEVRIDVALQKSTSRPVSLDIRITGPGCDVSKTIKGTGAAASLRVRLPHAQLWWPNGYGEQPLYRADVRASVGGSECDAAGTSFGIRSVRLVQERDAEGRSFIIEVNGVPIFCKGSDWIPSDSFLPRITDGTYERLLTAARDAHMNMIRIWGGGIYEDDRFYELCDRLGLLVWQDFMFACGEYPQYAEFFRSVRAEAEAVVVRLRNHPSLAVWCGNNECEWLFCNDNPGKTPNDMTGAPIFRDVLSAVCRELDGTRPYWRSSPFGRGFPNAESNGNHHQWTVWSAWKDYPAYEQDHARFVTEFGFQAPANRRTYEEVFAPEDLSPHSPVMEHHNRQVEGPERLARFQAAHFPLTDDFDRFIFQGQMVQAEALKTAMEHWRRRKFRTAGALFWQLNDCWPVSSWSVIDSALRPKPAYFYARRFFAPVLVSFKRTAHGVEVWGVNDRLSPVRAKLVVCALTFDGHELWRAEKNVVLKANASAQLLSIDPSTVSGFDSASCYLYTQLRGVNGAESENRLYFSEPKHLQLPKAKITVAFEQITGGFTVALRANAHVRALWLQVEGADGQWLDNCVDLEAGESRRIRFETHLDETRVRSAFRMRAISPLVNH